MDIDQYYEFGFMKKNFGFSLIEIMASIAVIGIATSTAVPLFGDYLENTRLRAAAERVYSDMQLARSEAIKTNSDLHMSVNSSNSWCYGFSSAANCNCSTSACDTNVPKIKNIGISANTAIQNGIHISPNGAIYDANNVTTSGQITFSSSNAKSIVVNISRLGNTSICSSTVLGYSTCP